MITYFVQYLKQHWTEIANTFRRTPDCDGHSKQTLLIMVKVVLFTALAITSNIYVSN